MQKRVIWISLLLFSLFFVGCSSEDYLAASSLLDRNFTLSADAYIELNGVAYEIPANITKIGEEYGYYLNNLSLDISNVTSFKIIDNEKVVFEYYKEQKTGGFRYEDLEGSVKDK